MKLAQLITGIFLSASSICVAQIGIGTAQPQKDLHVAGDLLIQSDFTTGAFMTVSDSEEDFELITRVTNSVPEGELKVLDTETLAVAPVNTFEYEFTNVYRDNVTNVDLQFDTSKYIVTVANFRYEGDAIKKQEIGGQKEIGYFVQRPFEENGTWHLEIRNRALDLDVGDELTYKITLIVYDRAYFKKLPLISTNLGGSNTGIAVSVPVLN